MKKTNILISTEQTELKDLPIEYVEGGGPDFVAYISKFGDKAQVYGVDGHFRWVITREDGTKYIARPISTK